MKIQLIKSDLNEGIRMDCRFCPIARAIKRITNAKYVYVSWDKINIDDISYKIPYNVQKFIDLFDMGAKNLPLIEFELSS